MGACSIVDHTQKGDQDDDDVDADDEESVAVSHGAT